MSAYKRGAEMKTINVLSIDGGGIRGIIPAMVLTEIEKRTGKRISELFDIIAGTSTGGILALALSKPKNKGSDEPAYTASELVRLYENEGQEIFPKSAWGGIRQMMGAKYPVVGLEKLLKEYFGDARLKEALTRVIIASYNLETRTSWFFKSEKARNIDGSSPDPEKIETRYDYPMVDVARATGAAPTYFRPAKIKGRTDGIDKEMVLVDGGVQANNPAMCAYAEAVDLNGQAEICVVSLGTGEVPQKDRVKKADQWSEQADKWGLLGWAKPVIKMTMDGPGDTVDYQLRKLLRKGDKNHYYRIQTDLAADSEELDNVGAQNISGLKSFTQTMISDEENSKRIGDACKTLMDNKGYPVKGLNLYP